VKGIDQAGQTSRQPAGGTNDKRCSDLSALRIPPEDFFWACFNDDCSYYQDGWKWMEQQFGQRASYRFMINPTTGAASMIPVWSNVATREMIVEDDGGGE
jgi:hypothetical protein